MSDAETARQNETNVPEFWSIFRASKDEMEGLIAKELIKAEDSISVYWPARGDPTQIAARLREMANALEGRMEKYVKD